MDNIRKLRIKHEDGSFSNSIPIGANSDDIFMTTGGTLTEAMTDVENAIISMDKINKTQSKSIDGLVEGVSSNMAAIAKQQEVNEKQEVKMENFEKALAQEKVYVFDNVYAMKNANNLKVGMYCITKGYYTSNDGGKGEYLIRTKTDNDVDDGGSIHELLNDLVAELIIENSEINVKQLGAYGDGLHDDTAIIQKSIDTYNYAFIPKGVFLVTTLQLKKGCIVKGIDKNNSILKSKNTEYSDDTAMLYGDFTNSQGLDRVIIKNIKLDGDHYGVTGIKIFKTTSQIHPGQHTIENVYIQYFKNNGINLGFGASETNVIETDIYNCGKNGVVIETNDCVISNVDSHNNEYNGFYINGGFNRFSDCKAWWNGRNLNAEQEERKHGFFVKAYQNQFVNCVAQENANYGFYIENALGITFNSCNADRNGLPMTNWSSDSPAVPYGIGVNIYNSNDIVFDGNTWDFLKYQKGETQIIGVQLNNSTHCYINIINKDVDKPYDINGGDNLNIIVNGNKIIHNRDKMIGTYDLLNNVSNNYVEGVSSNTGVGYTFHTTNGAFQVATNKDNIIRILSFTREDNNIVYKASPITIYNNGDIQLGNNNCKMSFFGGTLRSKPLVDGVATDLQSTMNLLNLLVTELANLNLIKRN